MPLIKLETIINSTIEICFDLSRNIELHKISTAKTNETAIDGITKGLIGSGEFVTWQAKHFGIQQKLTTKITAYERPFHFRDEQVKGIFKQLRHDHYFSQKGNMVIMTDNFLFESPFGVFGQIFNKLVLTKYLHKFLIERNRIIKQLAETGKWNQLFG